MKTLMIAAALALVAGMAQAADPVMGSWKTQVDDGAYAHIKMVPCAGKICGVIEKSFNDQGEFKSPNTGKKLVWDMDANGGGAYSGGKIWQPSTGKEYKSTMALNGDVLKVSGCFGPICKKQTWTRIK